MLNLRDNVLQIAKPTALAGARRPLTEALLVTDPTAEAEIPRQHLTFKFRLLPTRGQHARLRVALDHTRDLYNAALEHRIAAYQKAGRSISFVDHCRELTELRADADYATFPVTLQRWPLKQLDLAFQAFFRRVKAGGTAGFPRFKGREWFKTFGFTDRTGWGVVNGRLRVKGVGAIRLHMHRAMPSAAIACKVKREGRNWYALLTVETECAAAHDGPSVGIDVGIAHLATLSTGEHIANPRHTSRVQHKMRIAQRALARCKRGSRNRRKAKARVAALHTKTANARATRLHQITARLSREYGAICVEKLNVANMTRSAKGTADAPGKNVAAKAGLNREIASASFGRFKELLRYKAARAGAKFIEVDPRYSSQTCASCGVVDKASRLSQSRFVCTACGHEGNADVNAARIIALRGGVVVPGVVNVDHKVDRRRRKIGLEGISN